jgi:hypothetical protein
LFQRQFIARMFNAGWSWHWRSAGHVEMASVLAEHNELESIRSATRSKRRLMYVGCRDLQ